MFHYYRWQGWTIINHDKQVFYCNLYSDIWTTGSGGGSCILDEIYADFDGDGIAAIYDPFPDENVEFTAQELGNCQDSSGAKTFIKYKIVGTNGETTYLNHGDISSCVGQKTSILPNDTPPLSFQEFKDIYSEQTSDAALKALAEESSIRVETAAFGTGTTIEAPPEAPTMETGTAVDGTSSDREVSEATANNTGKIISNQEKLSGQLGTSNDFLREGVKNGAEQTGHLKDIKTGIDRLNDNLENWDPGEPGEPGDDESSGPYTGPTLENQDDYTNDSKFDEVKQRFQTRYQGFMDNVQSSELFTVPMSFFDGLPTSNVSDLTVNIGKWGGKTEATSTFDLNEFDNVWSVLATVLMILTSWTCIRIILLKKG